MDDEFLENEIEDKGEFIFKNLKTKKIFHFKDINKGFDILSRVIFKHQNTIVQFPFRSDGTPKYKFSKLILKNMPDPLPVGFIKSPFYGYGFTKEVSPFIFQLQDTFKNLNTLIIDHEGETKIIDDCTVQLSYKDIKSARDYIAPLLRRHSQEKSNTVSMVFDNLFPGLIHIKKSHYHPGELKTLIQTRAITSETLSTEDLQAITELIAKLKIEHSFVQEKKLLITKEKIELVYLEDVVYKFEQLLSQKTETKKLEDRWQEFFRENILYFNMGYVEKFEKERIQGDKSVNIPDYILLNAYGYMDVFEIKTHLTQLLSYDQGRKNFYWSSEATKAISQAENYIDSMIKQSDAITINIKDTYEIDVHIVRPKVYIIASSWDRIAGNNTADKFTKTLDKKMRNDYRRLNNSLKNIEFVLYDELLTTFKSTITRISRDE